MNKLKKILMVIGVIVIFLGFHAYFFPIATHWPGLVFLFGSTLIISGITLFSFKNKIIKILDFLYQAIPITWIFSGIFSGRISGQGFLVAILLVVFILPYQFLSSIIIVVRQFLKNELSRTSLLRLILCISTVGLLLLLFIANGNCWSVQDILTFSNKEVTDYKNYLVVHKGPFVTPLCAQLAASNAIFCRDTIFIFCIIPLFFILTLIERSLDMIKMMKNSESNI